MISPMGSPSSKIIRDASRRFWNSPRRTAQASSQTIVIPAKSAKDQMKMKTKNMLTRESASRQLWGTLCAKKDYRVFNGLALLLGGLTQSGLTRLGQITQLICAGVCYLAG